MCGPEQGRDISLNLSLFIGDNMKPQLNSLDFDHHNLILRQIAVGLAGVRDLSERYQSEDLEKILAHFQGMYMELGDTLMDIRVKNKGV